MCSLQLTYSTHHGVLFVTHLHYALGRVVYNTPTSLTGGVSGGVWSQSGRSEGVTEPADLTGLTTSTGDADFLGLPAGGLTDRGLTGRSGTSSSLSPVSCK